MAFSSHVSLWLCGISCAVSLLAVRRIRRPGGRFLAWLAGGCCLVSTGFAAVSTYVGYDLMTEISAQAEDVGTAHEFKVRALRELGFATVMPALFALAFFAFTVWKYTRRTSPNPQV